MESCNRVLHGKGKRAEWRLQTHGDDTVCFSCTQAEEPVETPGDCIPRVHGPILAHHLVFGHIGSSIYVLMVYGNFLTTTEESSSTPYGSKNEKYLLSGPFQKKIANSWCRLSK